MHFFLFQVTFLLIVFVAQCILCFKIANTIFMDTEQQNSSQQPEQSQRQPDLINLWEQMGASTGSLIGRFIGLNAQLGLHALQSLKTAVPETEAGIRTRVWSQMSQAYSESLGHNIGLAMDSFINAVDNTLIQPLAEIEKQQHK